MPVQEMITLLPDNTVALIQMGGILSLPEPTHDPFDRRARERDHRGR